MIAGDDLSGRLGVYSTLYAVDKGRLEAFSDGVIAVIITIMVLELKVPHDATLAVLGPMIPTFLTYVLSFVFVGIYWNNHHHMFHAVQKINGGILWANLHLLFWLSLVPWVTGWMGENHFAAIPVAVYGAVLFMNGMAYYLMAQRLVRHHGRDSALGRAIGGDFKGKMSLGIYFAAVALSFVNPWISIGLYVCVAVMWFVPDRRIERTLAD
jgi:uncharacterized membrane protein